MPETLRHYTFIGERCPSWNDDYAGRHWSARHRLAAEKHQLVRTQIDPDLPMLDERVDIIFVATYTDHPVDSCNLMAKLYIDGLIGWDIEDDDLRFVRSTLAIPRVGPENRVDIIIEQCGPLHHAVQFNHPAD